MKNSGVVGICTILLLTAFMWLFPVGTYGQSQSFKNTANTISDNGNSVVSVSTSVTVQVSNASLKTKDAMLKSSVTNFLNSGPNVLKTPQTSQPEVRSKISNEVNNQTQEIQGIEATNAIIGVEIGKALKTVVSSIRDSNQSALVTIQTSSTCKPLGTSSISCQNTVKIK